MFRCMHITDVYVYLQIMFIITLMQYTSPDYGDGYVYGTTAIAFGIAIGLIPDIGFIAYGVMALLRRKGTFMEVWTGTT